MGSLTQSQLQKRLEFVRYAKKQRTILVECIDNYPQVFNKQDLKEFDKTIFQLYVYNKQHNIFENIDFVPLNDHKQLMDCLFLNEQINPRLLSIKTNPALKSQIDSVDNIYKFFSKLIKTPLSKTGIGSLAKFYLSSQIPKLSEELNSLYGMGQAKGIKGAVRRGVGFVQRTAGKLFNKGMVQEDLAAAAGRTGSGVLTSVAMAALTKKFAAKLENLKNDESEIKNDIIDLVNKYGLPSTMQFIGVLIRQFGLPFMLNVLRTTLAGSPLAQTIIAGITSGAGLAATGAALGAGAAIAGATFAGGKFLEARAQKIKTIKDTQIAIQDFLDEAVESADKIFVDWNKFAQYANVYEELNINVESYKKLFNNNIQALKDAIVQTQTAMQPFYTKTVA